MYSLPDVASIVASALAEDLGVTADAFTPGRVDRGLLARDVTSDSVLPPNAAFQGAIVAREALTVAGLQVAETVWTTLARTAGMPGTVEVFPLVAEGAHVTGGTPLAEVSGPARIVLAGERTALNFVMVLSGIATETARWVAAAGPTVAVCDTRKTTPGLRVLSKYAVLVGGGTNHRQGLWDMVLVKDNHIAVAGGIEQAAQAARQKHPDLLVEIEADTIEAARQAALAGADIVLLDNMSDAELAESVKAVRAIAAAGGRAILTEASGGVEFARLSAIAAAGVDRVSTSALTFAAPVDVALDER